MIKNPSESNFREKFEILQMNIDIKAVNTPSVKRQDPIGMHLPLYLPISVIVKERCSMDYHV